MFDKLVEYFGSIEKLAEYLGVSPQIVYIWRNRGYIPPLRAIQIEYLSGGDFLALDLIDQAIFEKWQNDTI